MLRKASFWGSVALVSVLANYALTMVTQKAGSTGLARFTAYAHSSGGA